LDRPEVFTLELWFNFAESRCTEDLLDVDAVELRAQADDSMPAFNNNVYSHYILCKL